MAQKAMKKYPVLRVVTVVESNKNEGELIFKTNEGKLFFIDKKFPEGYERISYGDKLLVWVTKEFESMGYVRVTIDGITIIEHINGLSEKRLDDYKSDSISERCDSLMLLNYLRYNDIGFTRYLKTITVGGIIVEGKSVSIRDGLELYLENEHNTDQDTLVRDMLVADNYLLSKYLPL